MTPSRDNTIYERMVRVNRDTFGPASAAVSYAEIEKPVWEICIERVLRAVEHSNYAVTAALPHPATNERQR